MRNAGFTPDCGCGPVIGEIRHGYKYRFGEPATDEEIRELLMDINDELKRLDRKCYDLYEKNAVNEANIINNKENISDIRTSIASIRESISQTKENVMALMTSIEKVNAKSDTNTAAINEIRAKLNSIEGDVNNINGAVMNLTNDISNVKVEFTATTDALSQRIAALEDGEGMITIDSFTVNPKQAQVGDSVNAVIEWTLSRPEKRADINGIDVTNLNSYTATDIDRTTEFKLTVYDSKNRKVTASAKVEFNNYIYWGASSEDTITETLVKLLGSKELSDSKSRVISFDDLDDQYVYYAYPKRLGPATFRLGMFAGGFESPVVMNITNTTGYSEDYYVYRSENSFTYENVEFVVL